MRQIGKRCALVCGLSLVFAACSREPEPTPVVPQQEFTPAAGTSQPPAMRCAQNFRVFDANHDGRVSKPEFLAHPHLRANAEQIFAARDSNGDGFLTEAEFCSGRGRGMGPAMGGRHMGPGMTGGQHNPASTGMGPSNAGDAGARPPVQSP